jgi:hypothetical protein
MERRVCTIGMRWPCSLMAWLLIAPCSRRYLVTLTIHPDKEGGARIPKPVSAFRGRRHMCKSSSTRVGIACRRLKSGIRMAAKSVLNRLWRLGYHVPNTSAIERRNATARLMSAAQVRKTLAFAGKESTKEAMGWWGMTVYNWCRPHRSLKQRCYLRHG